MIFYLAYFTLMPLAFFGTLGTAHGPMVNRKLKLLQDLSNEFDEEYFTTERERPTRNKERFERLERIQSIHLMTQGFQVWPWDQGSIRLFALANGPIAVTTGATVAIEVFVL